LLLTAYTGVLRRFANGRDLAHVWHVATMLAEQIALLRVPEAGLSQESVNLKYSAKTPLLRINTLSQTNKKLLEINRETQK
jgi:hypothetical protein